jgi:hypothetical protein
MSPILKIDKDNEEKEIDFDLDYQLSLWLTACDLIIASKNHDKLI